MAIDTIHTRPEPTTVQTAGVVDVSGLHTETIEQFASGETVHLERRGGRTFLVTAD